MRYSYYTTIDCHSPPDKSGVLWQKKDRKTAVVYAQMRLALKRKGRPIPMNDVWIAAQCLERSWVLVTDDSDFDYMDGLVIDHWEALDI